MKTIYTDQHRLRDAQTELYGGELVKPFERPSRADTVIAAVRDSTLGPVEAPDDTLGSSLNCGPVGAISKKLFFPHVGNEFFRA